MQHNHLRGARVRPRLAAGVIALVAIAGCATSSKAAPTTTTGPSPSSTPAQHASSSASTSPATSSSPASTSTAPVPPTKTVYLADANAICKTMNAKINALGNPGSDPRQQASSLDATAAIESQSLRGLRALLPPPGEAAALDDVYSKVAVFIADSAPVSAALRSGDQAAIKSTESKFNADGKVANSASSAYGLTACGS